MAQEAVNVRGKPAAGQRTSFIYPGVEHFGAKQEIVFADYSKRRLVRENFITSCALIERETYLAAGGMCEGEIRYFEDYDFWLRLASMNLVGKLLREPLFQYRRHPAGRSNAIYSLVNETVYREELRRNNPVVFGDLPPNHPLLADLPCYRPMDTSKDESHSNEIAALAQRVDTTPSSVWHGALVRLITTPTLSNTMAPFSRGKDSPKAEVSEGKPRVPSLIYIIPWMVMGGADLYDLHVLGGLRELGARVTLVTTIETTHSWEGQFRAVVDEVFYLPRITNDSARVDAILDHLLLSRDATVIVSRNNDAGYRAFGRWRMRLTNPDLVLADILHLENTAYEDRQEQPQPGWVEKSQGYDGAMTWRLIASDNLLRHIIKTQGISLTHFTVLYPAVEAKRYHPRYTAGGKLEKLPVRLRRAMRTGKEPVVTFVGRFEEQKDPITWVNVAAAVAKQRPDTVFLMVGDGWLRSLAEFKVQEAELGARFVFAGQLDHSEVLDYLGSSTVLLLSSIYEGVPIVILEGRLLVGLGFQ